MPPRVKTGANYLNSRYALLESRLKNHDVPILLNRDGNVSESSGACVFMINKDTLITPALSDGILESITRDTVISLASELDIKTETRSINRTELMLANELFLCGSAAEITPICILDGRKVGMGCRGRITRQLTQLYFETVEGSNECHPEWLTTVRKPQKSKLF